MEFSDFVTPSNPELRKKLDSLVGSSFTLTWVLGNLLEARSFSIVSLTQAPSGKYSLGFKFDGASEATELEGSSLEMLSIDLSLFFKALPRSAAELEAEVDSVMLEMSKALALIVAEKEKLVEQLSLVMKECDELMPSHYRWAAFADRLMEKSIRDGIKFPVMPFVGSPVIELPPTDIYILPFPSLSGVASKELVARSLFEEKQLKMADYKKEFSQAKQECRGLMRKIDALSQSLAELKDSCLKLKARVLMMDAVLNNSGPPSAKKAGGSCDKAAPELRALKRRPSCNGDLPKRAVHGNGNAASHWSPAAPNVQPKPEVGKSADREGRAHALFECN